MLRGCSCRRPHASAPEALTAVQSALQSTPSRQPSSALSLGRTLPRQLSSGSSLTQNGLRGMSGTSDSPQRARQRGTCCNTLC